MKRLMFGTLDQSSPVVATAWLLLRLHVGLSTAISAGFPKVRAFPATDWFLEQVQGMGFPLAGAWAFVAAWTEIVCGFLVAFGFGTRPAAALLTIHFAVAAFLYHKSFPIVDLETAQILMWVFVTITAIGGGRFALERLVMAQDARR